jgi:DNA-binding response OmpR family regulator
MVTTDPVTHHMPEAVPQWGGGSTERRAGRVLLIDSSPYDGVLIATALSQRGYMVRVASAGLLGLGLLKGDAPDVVILDPRLPDVDGFELCQRIRELSRVPVLMLSTRFDKTDVVRGLGVGADDVLTRSVGLDELLARLEALMRRSRLEDATDGSLPLGDLAIDTASRTVVRRGREIQLTPHEYRLLYHLALNAGMVLTRDELLTWVWGPGRMGRGGLLRATIKRLRAKLEDDPASPRYVLTRRGVGYLFAARRSS